MNLSFEYDIRAWTSTQLPKEIARPHLNESGNYNYLALGVVVYRWSMLKVLKIFFIHRRKTEQGLKFKSQHEILGGDRMGVQIIYFGCL